MLDGLLRIDVLAGPVPVAVYAAAAVALLALLLRRPTKSWLLRAGIAVACGLVGAVATWLVCVRWLNLFGESLGAANYAWIAAAFCATAVSIASMRRTPRWRTVVAIAGIPVFIIAATIGINAYYGINRTAGSLLAIAVPEPIHLTPPPHDPGGYDAALWKHWTPPADMPEHGLVGTQRIPGPVSGFHARDAGIYLPPAAQVKHPPTLPVIVMMMGQPGNPDPEPIAGVLDAFAAKHQGLAPVVIVADQLGNAYQDTLCLNTKRFGNVEDYVTSDVTSWAEKNLPVTHDHRFWTVAGYSNGGLCALTFAIDHPDEFMNILDVSGEEFAGAEHPSQTLQQEFNGSTEDYERVKPFVKLSHFAHPGMTAIFSACRDDPAYHHVALSAVRSARGAGLNTAFIDIPAGGHGRKALLGGLTGGIELLYPILGLAAPG